MFQARLRLAVLLALLAAIGGCSSDTDGPAQAGDTTPPSPTASATLSASRPTSSAGEEFAFPDDVKLEFEIPPTGDKTQRAILDAWMNFEKSIVKAALSKDWSDRTYQKYSDPPVQLIIGEYLERKKATHSSVIGTRRFFNAQVEDPSKKISLIIVCQDDTIFYGRDVDTGRRLYTTPSRRDFTRVTAGMVFRKSKWLVASYAAEEGAKACVR